MNVTVLSPPPFEPITLADIYRSLRLDTEDSPETHADDAMLLGHIAAACRDVEQRTRRSLVQQTLRLSLAGFPMSEAAYALLSPSARRSALCAIRIPRPPLVRVESVQYYDAANALVTVSAADYYVTDDQVPELRFTDGFVPPTTYARPDALRVTYVAGYTPEASPPSTQAEYAANVPQPLKQAAILLVQALYDDLQPADWNRIQMAADALLSPYRVQHAL